MSLSDLLPPDVGLGVTAVTVSPNLIAIAAATNTPPPWRTRQPGPASGAPARLQFGHGSPPWRTGCEGARHDPRSPASIRPRLTAVENASLPFKNCAALKLQFGHGSPPWRTRSSWS